MRRSPVPQSALAVNVGEAEKCVSAIRAQFDPSARLGAPAHITLLYPFVEPTDIDAPVLTALEAVVSGTASFAFRLATIGRFTDTLYLAPEPAKPFIALTHALVARFPLLLPYGGQFESVVPHLTVARGSPDELSCAKTRLSANLAATGGIRGQCREVVLIENSSGHWQPMRAFALALKDATAGS